MVTRLVQFFFPELNAQEVRKYGLLSASFFLIIGVYWLMRLVKNVVLYKMAFPVELGWVEGYGRMMQPVAKFWSPFVVIALVLVYSKLIDIFKKQTLFYIICTVYTILFAAIGVVLAIKAGHGAESVGRTLLATVGWVGYFATESFGSLVVALFWSFVASVSTTAEAKKGYPLIVTAGQAGAIGGSTLLLFAEQIGGLWRIFPIAACITFGVIPTIYYFMKTTPSELLVGNPEAAKTVKKKDGFFEGFTVGLTLLVTRPYLIGILLVSTLYEIASAIIEYQMHVQADLFPGFAGEIGFAQFEAYYGIATNVLSFFIALLGTSYILKRFGLRISLLIYPVCFLGALASLFVFYFYAAPGAAALLWATSGVMIIVKGLSYAINNPTKEMMYIPTSKDAKFKAKGWVDMFGSRSAKAAGGRITNMFKHSFSDLMMYGTIFSFGLIGVWILAALYVGKKNAQLIRDDEIVE